MMVITTTLHDLQSGTGHAVTGGGGLLPMSEVIRQASKAHHYLAVFDKHTAEPLYLGRAKRLASTAQRIMLYAKERGCTFPGCTAPAYHSQVHHAVADWVDGGQTNITDETLACGTDNRRVKRGGWRTRKLTAAGALARRSYRSSAVSGATSAARPGITPAGGRVAPGVAARRCLLPMCG